MAGAVSHAPVNLGRIHGAICCSGASANRIPEFITFAGNHSVRCCSRASGNGTPRFIRFAVSGVTEILRLISPATSPNKGRLNRESSRPREITVSSIDDVAMILESDYANAYFVTGNFTSDIYADNCLFEDPTIRFQGTGLYERNLELLVPFFDRQSIELQRIEKGVASNVNFIKATWKLRTYLKLPWRPLISVNGTTVYELDNCFKIVRHSESWDVSAVEAIIQIFTPSGQRQDQF